ncbi:MAG: TIGR01777 family oxidoreductase [Bacteroidota bacterium]
MKIIAIAGSGGFIGSNVKKYFGNKYEIIQVNRTDFSDKYRLTRKLKEVDYIMNFTGTNLLKPWNKKNKQLFENSRIGTTAFLKNALYESGNKRLAAFINASAIGIYSEEGIHDERSDNFADNYLSWLIQEWEGSFFENSSNSDNSKSSYRKVAMRFGMVLDKNGGALKLMKKFFSFGVGGYIGNGNQPISFIVMDDLVNSIQHVIQDDNLNGIVNVVAPSYTTNKELSKILAYKMNRPCWPIPSFGVKVLFGSGSKIVLEGQRVIPQKLLNSGFKFKCNNIQEALDYLI